MVAHAQCQEERMRLESQDLMRQVQEEQRRNAEIKQVCKVIIHTFLRSVQIFFVKVRGLISVFENKFLN
jgi:hypothetical protein